MRETRRAMLAAGVIDLMWAALFIVAFKRTSETAKLSGARRGLTSETYSNHLCKRGKLS
jgi:hypothetical protein